MLYVTARIVAFPDVLDAAVAVSLFLGLGSSIGFTRNDDFGGM
jgi:hypothetical protein